jgi:hypothetical protein
MFSVRRKEVLQLVYEEKEKEKKKVRFYISWISKIARSTIEIMIMVFFPLSLGLI